MAIKGLTNRGLAFPEIGQIRKGSPKTEKAPGRDLAYFRVTFDEKETEAATQFEQVYGKTPDEIRIVLPFNDLDRMWEAWLEAYTAGRLVARSDGEKFIYWVDTRTGETKVQNGVPETPYKDRMEVGKERSGKSIVCKPAGRLKVIIPELARAAYLTVLTTSLHDIANIDSQLSAFKELNNGQIAGIPLMLRRRPKKISCPGKDGNRVRMTKYMLSIEADPAWVKAKLMEVKRLALPGNGLALLPGQTEPHEEYIETESQYIDEDEDEGEVTGEVVEEAVTETTTTSEPEDIEPADPATAYWSLCYDVLKWSQKDAKATLDRYNGDLVKAFNAAKRQMPN